jgi:micrococcal nuclease
MTIKDRIQDLIDDGHGPKLIAGGAALFILIIIAAILLFSGGKNEKPISERIHEVEAKRVVNGHYVKLKDDLKLMYLGVRSPWEDEPMYLESKERNEELVVGKELRLRYDGDDTDEDGRLVAYAFLEDETFVNEVMIREGLAYARLYPQVQRFRQQLLVAQKKARKDRIGIWSYPAPEPAESYPADPKYAEFHRPDCEVVPRIKPERLVTYESRDKAFDEGMHPCNKCNP